MFIFFYNIWELYNCTYWNNEQNYLTVAFLPAMILCGIWYQLCILWVVHIKEKIIKIKNIYASKFIYPHCQLEKFL